MCVLPGFPTCIHRRAKRDRASVTARRVAEAAPAGEPGAARLCEPSENWRLMVGGCLDRVARPGRGEVALTAQQATRPRASISHRPDGVTWSLRGTVGGRHEPLIGSW